MSYHVANQENLTGRTRGPVTLPGDEEKDFEAGRPMQVAAREREMEQAHYDHAWLSLLYLNKVPQAHLVSG